MAQRKSFATQIFDSYVAESRSRRGLTQPDWLGGKDGWRDPLRKIAKIAYHVNQIRSIEAARDEWSDEIYKRNKWMKNYLFTVPFLEELVTLAEYDDKVFRELMRNLTNLGRV